MFHRLLLAALTLFGAAALAHAADEVDVYRSPGCGCCALWAKHLEESGFKVRLHNLPQSRLDRIKTEAGVPEEHASCHTAKVGGYIVEGHVPAEDVERLLKERPDAVGLAVPGMPIGSPGMEVGDARDPYDVLLLKKDGTAETYARH
jgi:hypothetical protein